ncbi:hypothetical protein MASR2M32_04580 [Sphaerotilus sulfidivorans]|nr:hypothetical protein CQA4T8M7_32960 [Sphaerotilus natans]GKQ57006.1 hypothetical protein QMTAC487_08640 [Sphaerotilus sp. FB-3]
MSSPRDGTQAHCSMTGTPLNTVGACDSNTARLAAVIVPAMDAVHARRRAPLTAVSTLPSTKGNRTTSSSTCIPPKLPGFYG